MGEVYGTGDNLNIDSESCIIVSSWLEDLGYSIDDTIKFTLCPVTVEFDEDSRAVKDVRRKLMEENGTSVLRDDPEYSDIDSEERKNTYKGTLKNAFTLHCNIDFDDGLMTLYGTLGFNEENYYNDLPEINNKLLFFEFKSAGEMVQMFPLLLIIFVFIFFAWLFARFVIDNAFEISSQERST